ncbi:hypothetical protein HMPREF3190_00398 [Umbribacter vaginalis]|nr:hypothetical protein HMPREF3190_00398 [Coriobacteriales bacterium DNF00809]
MHIVVLLHEPGEYCCCFVSCTQLYILLYTARFCTNVVRMQRESTSAMYECSVSQQIQSAFTAAHSLCVIATLL